MKYASRSQAEQKFKQRAERAAVAGTVVQQHGLAETLRQSPQVTRLRALSAAMNGRARAMVQRQRSAAAAPTDGATSAGVVQRAIQVGSTPVPRTRDIPQTILAQIQSQNVATQFAQLNDDRTTIYVFVDDAHLLNYLKFMAGGLPAPAPTLRHVSQVQVDLGHQRAQDQRFYSLHAPTPQQIPQSAPGAHNIAPAMMPPPGPSHQWGQSSVGGGREYTLYQHISSTTPTVPLTYGNPSAPSLVMNQGGLNLGMHIQPAPSAYLEHVTRQTTTYGGLQSAPGRVRGHAFALEQNQVSTEDDSTTFDNDPRTYTDESDATKYMGGTSTWRYNQVERPSISSRRPFTQVNENPVIGPMGIAQPPTIRYRAQNADGTFDDRLMDNSATTDYRHAPRPARIRQQAFQSEMGRRADTVSPYQAPTIRQPGSDYLPADRRTYSGYMSPPPTPFLAERETEDFILDGLPNVGDRVHHLPGGRTGRVDKVLSRDYVRSKSQCRVLLDP